MRVLICGSRHFDDWGLLRKVLYDLERTEEVIIIQGGAKGADFLARVWAKYVGHECIEYPADWNKYGKAAGHIRNTQMLDEGKPDLVIAFLAKDSKGTANMIKQAEDRNIPVKVINI